MKDIPSSNFQASKNSQSKNFFGRNQYKTAISIARPAPLPPKLPTPQQLNASTPQQLNTSTPQQLNTSTPQHLNPSTAQLLSKLKQPFIKKPAQDPAVSQEELNRLEAEQLLKLVTQSNKASKQKKISKKVLKQQGLLKLNLAKPVIPGHVRRPFAVPKTLSQLDLKYLLTPQHLNTSTPQLLNASTPLHELSSLIDFAKIEADFNLPRGAPLPPPVLRSPAIKLYPTRSEARRASRLARLEALKAKQTLQRLGLGPSTAQPLNTSTPKDQTEQSPPDPQQQPPPPPFQNRAIDSPEPFAAPVSPPAAQRIEEADLRGQKSEAPAAAEAGLGSGDLPVALHIPRFERPFARLTPRPSPQEKLPPRPDRPALKGNRAPLRPHTRGRRPRLPDRRKEDLKATFRPFNPRQRPPQAPLEGKDPRSHPRRHRHGQGGDRGEVACRV